MREAVEQLERDLAAAEAARKDETDKHLVTIRTLAAMWSERDELRDVISRAIKRLDPNAPNDEPYMLTGAVTVALADRDSLQRQIEAVRALPRVRIERQDRPDIVYVDAAALDAALSAKGGEKP